MCVYTYLYYIYIVSVYRSYIHLVKFIPKNFILFDAALNDIVFLSSFSSSSLLLDINSRDFCIIMKNKRRTKYKAKGKVEVLYNTCVSIFMKTCPSYDLMSKRRVGATHLYLSFFFSLLLMPRLHFSHII